MGKKYVVYGTYVTLVILSKSVRSKISVLGEVSAGTWTVNRSSPKIMSQMMMLKTFWSSTPRTDTYTNWEVGVVWVKKHNNMKNIQTLITAITQVHDYEGERHLHLYSFLCSIYKKTSQHCNMGFSWCVGAI